MPIWTRTRHEELAANAAYNLAASSRAGFAPDRGRVLSAEEVAGLKLTPPEEITKELWIIGEYHWR